MNIKNKLGLNDDKTDTATSNTISEDTLDQKYEAILDDIQNDNTSKYTVNIRSYEQLKDSDEFDADYYIYTYNLPISRKYALLHYLDVGFKKGMNPNPDFSGREYYKLNPDVKSAGLNPLVHYELYGKKEGRDYPYNEVLKLEQKIKKVDTAVYQNRIIGNLTLLRNKVSCGRKVNVVFILPAMMFVYKDLYELFDEDDLFNVNIVLVPHRLGSNPNISDVAKDKYYQIFSHLEERNFNVVEGYDFKTNEGINLEQTLKPDIIFYVLPYMRIYPENMQVDNLPPNILYAYIPYGEFLENDLDDNLYNFGWNEKIWKIFCSTNAYLTNASKKSPAGSSNVIVSGSARMDALINYKPSENDYQWIYPREENKKRFIWAPHHTLSRPNMDEKIAYSTFDQNYKFFYEYAKNHPDTEWVLRPHPLLKEVLSKINTNMKINGIADENFADDYFFKWNSLPNATVHEELDYFDLFANADAMITDCVSFKAEYLYADKPGLILKKEGVEYDGYKGTITDAWYVANGSDHAKIREFIEDVVINGNDYLKEKREKIFKENFDYNVGTASKTIHDYIKNELI